MARIDFWFRRDRKTPHLVPDPKNDLFPFARVTFTNSQQRYIVLVENGFVTLAGDDNTTADGFRWNESGATGVPFPQPLQGNICQYLTASLWPTACL